jgi:non-ribosomal peptide synthetase component F
MRFCRSAHRRSRSIRTLEILGTDMLAKQAPVQTLRDVVDRNARLHGDELHLIFGERRATFRQFARRARKLASTLHSLGARAQDRISILAMNCPEYLEVYGAGEVAPFIIASRLRKSPTLFAMRHRSRCFLSSSTSHWSLRCGVNFPACNTTSA